MRVISGKYKGRQLVSFRADHIRPTTDRVKETLFNKLMGLVEGSRVLDLFSGTGNLAIECLSRGAVHVDMVESNRQSLAIIRENLSELKVSDGYQIHASDVFAFLKKFAAEPYDIVIADPPFTRSWAHDVATQVGARSVLRPEGLFVVEASAKERVDENYPGLNRLDRSTFGDKHLNFFGKI